MKEEEVPREHKLHNNLFSVCTSANQVTYMQCTELDSFSLTISNVRVGPLCTSSNQPFPCHGVKTTSVFHQPVSIYSDMFCKQVSPEMIILTYIRCLLWVRKLFKCFASVTLYVSKNPRMQLLLLLYLFYQ